MKAFVTGSTGLLGGNLVRALLGQGHTVKALARSRAKAEQVLAKLPVAIVEGDMADVPGFAPELDGCDVLFHTAAFFREYYAAGDHAAELEAINVEGSKRLMEEAHRRGVARGVDTGASGHRAQGVRRAGGRGDAACPDRARKSLFRSKARSEEKLRAFGAVTGFPIVFILPGWMFGPGDAAPTGSGQLVQDFLARKIPGRIDGGATVVDARDVAAAMIDAAHHGRAGERYIVGGEFADLKTIFRTLQKVSGVRAPRLAVPYAVSLGAAWGAQTYARFRGRSSVMSVEGVRTMHAKLRVSSAKAKRELGVTFRPLEATLRDEVAWFRAQPERIP